MDHLAHFMKKDIIVLVESTDNGEDAWWYVKCRNRIEAEKLKAICKLGILDNIPLDEYGEIIESGWGKHPPDEIKEKINAIL